MSCPSAVMCSSFCKSFLPISPTLSLSMLLQVQCPTFGFVDDEEGLPAAACM